jgi:hypothetical protein
MCISEAGQNDARAQVFFVGMVKLGEKLFPTDSQYFTMVDDKHRGLWLGGIQGVYVCVMEDSHRLQQFFQDGIQLFIRVIVDGQGAALFAVPEGNLGAQAGAQASLNIGRIGVAGRLALGRWLMAG